MLTRYLRGSTAELNALNLPPGHLAYDEERDALRYYDGSTQGGFEIVGESAFTLGPGPQELLTGDYQRGFFGEVGSDQLFTPEELALEVGISVGVGMSPETTWLKLASKGAIIFIPKAPIRHSVSWASLYQSGLVYGVDDFGTSPVGQPVNQLTPLESGQDGFIVRLLTGGAEVSEWDDLMVGLTDGSLAEYSPSELGVGTGSWVQEAVGTTLERVVRGASSIGDTSSENAFTESSSVAWRPVLELTTLTDLLLAATELRYETDYVQESYIYDWEWSDAPVEDEQ